MGGRGRGVREARAEARLEALEALVRQAHERAPRARARWKELEAIVIEARRGERSAREGGAALEEARVGKMWRLGGWATQAEWLASIELPSTTAHKWRVIARAGGAEAGESQRAAYTRARAISKVERVRKSLEAALAELGGRATVRIARGREELAATMSVRGWQRILAALPGR